MAIRDKIFVPESIYFITFTICKWQKVFTNKKYTDLIYKWFDYQKEKYKNKIYGYVIMPNHFHGLIYISEKSPNISKLIQNAKRFLAYDIIKNLKEDGREEILRIFRNHARIEKKAKHKVFEERYDSKGIDNEKIFLEKLKYIHNNPCQEHWQLAESPEEYPYSSASNYLLGKGVYDIDVLEE